jgi:aldose 1-epimerase
MKNQRVFYVVILLTVVGVACRTENKESGITTQPFGMMDSTEIVVQYTIRNKAGMEVRILNYGGTITDIIVPDRSGNFENVVLGFATLEGYRGKNNPYFGALIGRYANRIGKAAFQIGEERYPLSANNNGNTLHGGMKGFDKVIWNVKSVSDSSLLLTYHSADGGRGLSGKPDVEVLLTLGHNNTLTFEYKATTDKATPVSLTSHSYFNLSAGKSATIEKHELQILAEKITEVDDLLIPTGQFIEVFETPFNFLEMKTIGTRSRQRSGRI